jgi:hypothetical protein
VVLDLLVDEHERQHHEGGAPALREPGEDDDPAGEQLAQTPLAAYA